MAGFSHNNAGAQGMHFSQYYNAPMLLNPANTALLPDEDYRLGANYRNQWSSVPVPYNTLSAYADFSALRYKNEHNWLGLGAAFFSDKAGDGNLALNLFQAFAAYHIELGSANMLSFGASAGYAQRSVDLTKLTFDKQWDGFTFDGALPNGENSVTVKTSYATVGAGINYAYFPNENVYIKLGAGLANINRPKETFYYGQTNELGMRPTVNLDVLVRSTSHLIINPSVYYTEQKGAYELLGGSQFVIDLGGNNLILGLYYRWNDAIVGAVGFDWGRFRVMTTYDFTTSQLAQYNGSNGAFEIGFSWMGKYRKEDGSGHASYNCPRFF